MVWPCSCPAIPPCLIGMEACVGAHHLSRNLASWLPIRSIPLPAKWPACQMRDGIACSSLPVRQGADRDRVRSWYDELGE
jgi:hypothetical protein